MNDHTKKFKFHWGHGIAIFITLFVGTFVYLVLLSTTKEFDLQTENYYQEELAFEDVIQKKQNTANDHITSSIAHADSEGVVLEILGLSGQGTGTVTFYRPSSKHLDFELPLELNTGKQLIKHHKLKEGLYKVKIDFESKGTSYYIEKDFMY
ncbi:MAG: FixH family protein [Flavobacteriales bacterium]|nr:FixH family protein [Flavobacteriales bacterium]